MPLTEQQALELQQAIANIQFEKKIKWAQLRWISLMAPSVNPVSPPSSNDLNKNLEALAELQHRLIGVRQAHLNTKSVKIKFDEGSAFGKKTIRVFDPTRQKNFNSDVSDIFARGIDSANAVIEILKHAFPLKLRESQGALQSLTEHPNQKAIAALMKLLFHFKNQMANHEANLVGQKQIAAAMKELKQFNAALASLLVEYNVVKKRSHAEKAIGLVRDFVWKRDLCIAHCSIERKTPGSSHTMLRYAEPMTFGPSEFRLKKSDSRLDLWQTKERMWLHDFAEKLGLNQDSMNDSWFQKFLDANKEQLASLSSTPMTRFTPNPANAFDCTDFIVDDTNRLVHMGHHVRMAITDPLEIKNPIERQKLTDFNHLQLFSKARLAQEITAFMDSWGCLFQGADNRPIPLTILHQTLIGDEVTLSPDQTKAVSGFDGSVIDAKQEANEAVRTMLSKSLVLCERRKPHQVVILNKSLLKQTNNGIEVYEGPSGKRGKLLATYQYDDYQVVKVSLLETNNCVNMWHSRARIRNKDVNHARQLINNAVELFEECNKQLNDPNFSTIIDFLKSRDHSLITPHKHRGEKVKAAVRQFSATLRNNPLPGDLGELNRETLNLSLQAAVELKCTVHETWFGSMRRAISNFTRDVRDTVPVIGHLINWTTRFVLWTLATVFTILAFPLNAPSYIKHLADRKEISKANYEGLLAESIGALMGGCMSAADRAGEIDEQRAALRRQFADTGVLLGYNDSAEDKLAFFKNYGSTRTKHDNVEMATGTAVTNDAETRGFNPLLYVAKFLAAIHLISPDAVDLMTVGLMSSRVETPEERDANEQMSGLRKTSYDGKIRLSTQYLGDKTKSASQASADPEMQNRGADSRQSHAVIHRGELDENPIHVITSNFKS
ncbi:hypothetical protein DIZ81_11190 [Legionella taurinensis]|uniref:Uncharacterized protein n=2 Tax=Legionella taurinensis TaxID=70611 RepID=A0AB38N4Y1_9GAMM|nr:hypothetical protein [Legionella taurinensis]MDX1838417.1 hypothetical protein [Legionella taurinensis]PUT39169.1 hypothetical protein DB744_11200 [Legionella taurinensis]PUT39794.1 hypothetical protein DB746_13375 [Legionella taurinensis]PUT43626.1 hypothetical protein DB743_10595 [Legionella taurinensis]PUT45281.1 hypothetical protein DB745_13315 [Legionella taurinensis]